MPMKHNDKFQRPNIADIITEQLDAPIKVTQVWSKSVRIWLY
jgi:hypothetical protein